MRLALLLCLAASVAHAAPPPPEGIWLGALDVGKAKLRLAFHISRKPDGALVATLDSLDQSALGIPVPKASFADGVLALEIPAFAAGFTGKLAGDALDGKWTQGGKALPLAMKRVEKLDPPKRPQEPKRPFAYREEEVTIPVGKNITLAGTLSLPQGQGPFPAVLFITGSGPQDRDETVFDHKPFLVVSDALVKRGIATLRLDDVGVGKSTGSSAQLTSLDLAEHVRSAFAWLAARSETQGRPLGLIGHSEGGLLAPIVASSTPRVGFLVLLAGTGQPGEAVLRAQNAAIRRAAGSSEAEVERDWKEQQAGYAAIRSAKTQAEVDAAVRAFIASDPKQEADRKTAERSLRSPWLRTFLSLDPATYFEKLTVPVLALNGERDLQVDPENLRLIAAALGRSKAKDVTTRVLPGLNHLFQHARTGAPSEYASIEETFAPEALQLVVDWVVKHTR